MPLLSSLVFLGVICSRCCEQHHCLHRDFSTSKTTVLPPPPLPLLRSDHRLHHRKVISLICLSVKYRLHRTFHAPPRATIILDVTGMRLHVPPLFVTRLHALPYARTQFADIIISATSALVTSSLLASACLCQHSAAITSSPLTVLTLTGTFTLTVDFSLC